MKLVYQARDAIEAELIRDLLESSGIPARVEGVNHAALQGYIPSVRPTVWTVRDSDEANAIGLIGRHQLAPESQVAGACARCGEAAEPDFEVCWKCGAELPRERW